MNKYIKIKTTIFKNIKDEKIPFNNKIFIWFISFFFFSFFFKKKISNDAAYFDYLFTNNISKDHSLLSDIASRVGWVTLKERSQNSYSNYDIPDNDIPNQQFFSQTRRMQGVMDTGMENLNSDFLYINEYKNNSTFSQKGSYVPLIYDSNPLEDTQFIEKASSIYRLHWLVFFFSIIIYCLEVLSLFFILYSSLDFFVYFNGFCWNIFELSVKYPSRFIWLNFSLGSYEIDIYKTLPLFCKISILFIWHLWYYSKFLFFVFFVIFINFIYVIITFTIIIIYNIYLKIFNLNLNPPSDGYFGDFSHLDFSENIPEFSTKGASLFRANNNNLASDNPVGEATQLSRGDIEEEELANEFFFFFKDKDSILKMRPTAEFAFFFKSFILIFFFFMWYIILLLFLIFTINYFFFSIFRFIIYNDVYKYTLFNYIFGHINLFPILDWFYQFEINMKKMYNQRFFLEKYTNYIFSKGYSKLHYFFIKKEELNNKKLSKFFKEISKYNKEILLPRRMKSKRYFYRSLTPLIADIDKYFKNGIASKRILFDFVYFKHYTSFQNKIVYLPTKDNVNYYLPNRTRLWLVNSRFKDFFTYIYDFITGSFFFSYIEFTNFKFFKIDDLTISRLLQITPQDENLYNETSKKTVIYSHYYDIPLSKSNYILKKQNRIKRVSDIFMEDFAYYGKSKTPEEFYLKILHSQNTFSIIKIMQEYYKYIFHYRNSFRKDYYNNLFRLNFKFEELFESLEHESDVFFDFSKRNLNASDIKTYLNFYWKQYTSIRNYRKNKIKTTMKINNFFVRSRLQFLKIFSKFDFVGTSFLFDSDENRKLFESFKYYKIKYLKKFLKFYGLFQFNSVLRKNKYLITNNFYKNFDLIKLRYFRNLELWKIFQFKTNFQHVFNRLNTRSFLGYYCNNNNTFPFVEYRDHFKSKLPREPYSWMKTAYAEEKLGYGEEIINQKTTVTGFPGGSLKNITPLNYFFYFDNDSWRNYRYNIKQKILDSSPKFLASSSYFNSYYFFVKYSPKEIYLDKTKNRFLFNNNVFEFNIFQIVLNIFIESFTLFKTKIWFLFIVWQWFFYLFIVYIANKISDDFSFRYSNTKYFYKNVKESIFFLNFLLSFFLFLFSFFVFFSFFYMNIKLINYITNDFLHYIYIKIISFFQECNFNNYINKKNNFKIKYFTLFFTCYFLFCVLIYVYFFSSLFFNYSLKILKNRKKSNEIFNDFAVKDLNLTRFSNNENKIFNSIDQITLYKKLKKK